jgi:hypothetical protein
MGRYRRRGMGVAALLTALAAVLALLTPAAATTAAAPVAVPPPSPPIGTIFVPSGTKDLDADQARTYIEQALADAIARAGIEARIELGAPESGGKNASVMWFDFSALFASLPADVAQRLSDAFVRVLLTRGLVTTDVTHKMSAEWLQRAGNDALFQRIGAGQGAKVLQFAATNVGDEDGAFGQSDQHAEEFILLQLERALRILATEFGLGLRKEAQLKAAIAAAALAIYSDRQNCADRCSALVKALFASNRNVALVYYGAKNPARIAKLLVRKLMRAATVPLALIRRDERIVAAIATGDEAALGRESEEASGAQRVQELRVAMGQAGDCGKGTPAVGHGPVGVSGAGGAGGARVAGGVGGAGGAGGARGAGGGVRGVAVPVPRAADGDCGKSKVRSGATSVLGQLLAAAVPADKYGGVDFSTLELRYISDSDDGVQFSYSADSLPGGYRQDQALGSRVVQLTAADLRTWLVLDPTTFWVNLDPQEPDRIIDDKLGRTNAGRAMLEADLAMKRTSGRLINPATPFGKRYWDAMTAGVTGTLCFSSRVWIVPGKVEVREDGSSLYVLRADLDVKTESEKGRGLGADCPPVDPATDERRERVERELVLPEIVKAVNTAPEYAPLRRAFLARVVAQWIRQRHDAGRRTSYDDVIGTGRLGPAELRDGWKPRQVYDEFLKSWNDKEFRYSVTTRQGDTIATSTFLFGGVDWSNLRYDGLSEAEMKAGYAHVADTVRTSADRPATAPDGSIWLGAAQPGPERSAWDRAVGRVSGLTDRRLGVALIVVVALAALAFGFRGPRRRATAPPAGD